MDCTKISPELDCKDSLARVAKPGRYVGGEYFPRKLEHNPVLTFALSFPDMYEIGMSNHAIKIIYGILNSIEGVRCERVFAPAPDFQTELKKRQLPLYSLESGTPLCCFDFIGFSIGHELTFTNILSILDLGNIPLNRHDRDETAPIVLGGGPSVTNPLPYSNHFDAVYIGEVESVMKDLFTELVEIKRAGGGVKALKERLSEEPAIWTPDKRGKVYRSVWNEFSVSSSFFDLFPVPNIKVVQDHGVIEIMRGCPNGCRFCHAGMIYRPMREKPCSQIIEEAETLINTSGYSEITLSSLSSGDYSQIVSLIRILNARYGGKAVSFAFPSLRINSFTLSLLQEISAVRKSGLTFAVETASSERQKGLNKVVDPSRIIEILIEAKKYGWRSAKFYFMIGLPICDTDIEAASIVDYLLNIQRAVQMNIHVNLASFIPKPHTPFQWAKQISKEKAEATLRSIKTQLKGKRFKVSYHSPFLSFIEGIISRGDERIGNLVEKAFDNGARFDAWEEYSNEKAWMDAFVCFDDSIVKEALREKETDEALPWDIVDVGIRKSFLLREYKKSYEPEETGPCSFSCGHNCGVCSGDNRNIVRAEDEENLYSEVLRQSYNDVDTRNENKNAEKVLFFFSKKSKAAFCSHLDLITIFERAFMRTGIRMKLTEGFNPKPKMEFAHPLSLGIESEEEVGSIVVFPDGFDNDENRTSRNSSIFGNFIERLNHNLPSGIFINQIMNISEFESKTKRKKKKSLMALYGGAEYIVSSIPGRENLKPLFRWIQENEAGEDCTVFDGDSAESENSIFTLKIKVRNSGRKKSNIMYVLTEYLKKCGVNMKPLENYTITRKKVYVKENEENGKLIPYSEYFDRFFDSSQY